MTNLNFWITLTASIITIITGLITIFSVVNKGQIKEEVKGNTLRNRLFGVAGLIVVSIALPLTAYSSLGRIFPGLYGPEWTDQVQYVVPKSGGKGEYIKKDFSIDYPKGTKVVDVDCKNAWKSNWNKKPVTTIDANNYRVVCTFSHKKHDSPLAVSMRVCYSRTGKGECP